MKIENYEGAFVFLLVFLMSCSDKKKEEKTAGVQMSEEAEKLTLNEEIDDEILEASVAINRNFTKGFLDYEKAGKIGLEETYQNEEPYSIVFLDGDNFVTYQAAEFKTSEIETNINLFIEVTSPPLNIKTTMISGFNISYTDYEYNNRKWVHSVIDIDDFDQRIMMQISSEQNINSEELIKKYLIVRTNS